MLWYLTAQLVHSNNYWLLPLYLAKPYLCHNFKQHFCYLTLHRWIQEKAGSDSSRWKTTVMPRMLCITLWWHSFLSDDMCKLKLPYSPATTHTTVCAMITTSTVQNMSLAKTKKKGSPTWKPKWAFFFGVKAESLQKSLIFIFQCFNRA